MSDLQKSQIGINGCGFLGPEDRKVLELSCIVAYLGRRRSKQCQILKNLESSTVTKQHAFQVADYRSSTATLSYKSR